MSDAPGPVPQIVQRGTPVLHQKAREVPKSMFGTPELEKMLADMSAALHTQDDGVAIAAPQIGLPYRIFLVRGYIWAGQERMPRQERDDSIPDVPFINPKVTKRSRKKEVMSEGCLSVRGFWGSIKRHVQATVAAHDFHGKKFERGGAGLMAQIFQHETDHLDGVLYVDKAEEVHEARPEKGEESHLHQKEEKV
jgi:peptide deformylase